MADIETVLYRPEDAARVLQIGRSKLYELIAAGELASVQIGRARRVPRQSLLDYTERLLADPAAEPRPAA